MHTDHTPHLIDTHTPTLSSEQKVALWNQIAGGLATTPVPSPYFFSFVRPRALAPLAVVAFLVLGLGGTVAASEPARPGDWLFPVDRALEEVRLALAQNDTTRAELQVQFAEERLNELRSILSERTVTRSTDDRTTTASSSLSHDTSISTVFVFAAEADIFSDVTIVKVEINDQIVTFETDADTREEVIDSIVDRFAVDRATVAAGLDFAIEDRVSRVNDRAPRGSDTRVDTSISLITELVGTRVDTDVRDRILSDLLRELGDADDRETNKDDHDQIRVGSDKLEIRTDDSRTKVRTRDGEVEVEIKHRDNTGDDNQDSDDDRSDNSSSGRSFEAKANVFSDITVVQVELNDRKTTFETTAGTRSAVVAVIADRFGIERATVDRVLDFEIEDRVSRVNDADDTTGTDDGRDDSDNRIKIEVRVEEGIAEVRMEYDGQHDEFETVYTTRTALVAALALRSGLSEAEISDSLDLEVRE